MRFRSRLKLPVLFSPLILVVAMFVPVHSTLAPTMQDGVPSIEYQQRSDLYQGSALWVSVERDGNRRWNGSGVRLNEWYGLTAAHLFLSGGIQSSNANVGTGRNFMTDRGVTRRITNILIIPGWFGTTDPLAGQPDLAIIKFDKPLPGRNLGIGTLVRRVSYVTSVGFGRAGHPAAGYALVDGSRRAFDGRFAGISGINPYLGAFSFVNDGNPPYGGKGLGGDSGSGVLNAAGELAGITVAGSLPTDSPGLGATSFTYLDTHRDWIATNTLVTEPRLLSDYRDGNLVLSWNGNYQLQSAPAVSGVYSNVSGATSPRTNSTALPSQFFRLSTFPEAPLPAPTVISNFGMLGLTAQATAYYCGHGAAGAIAAGSNSAVRMPAEPRADGGVVEVAYQPVFNPTNAFSVELWAKPSQTKVVAALASAQFLVASWPSGGWGLSQMNSAGTTGDGFRFDYYNTASNTAQSTAVVDLSVDTNAWYHLAAVFDGTNFTLYVNGGNVSSVALPNGISVRPNLLRPLTFGCTSSYGNWYSGDLDEAAFYTNALGAAQVLAHYQTGTNAAPATSYAAVVLNDGPAAYWRLGEAAASPMPAPTAIPAFAPVNLQTKTNPSLKQPAVVPFLWNERAEYLNVK